MRSWGLFPLPYSRMRSAGNPVAPATTSSPSERTSSAMSCSPIQRAIARHQNVFAAYPA
jgi:hypothetical protein